MAENAILAINSLDRYITSKPGQQNQPLGNALQKQYYITPIPVTPEFGPEFDYARPGPPCNNFSITSPGAILYGYIDRIIVSQIQLNYNIPTIIPDVNDTFYIIQGSVPMGTELYVKVVIPYGFYTPDELAATIQILIRTSSIGVVAPNFTVTYSPPQNNVNAFAGFNFYSGVFGDTFEFFFPSPSQYIDIINPDLTRDSPIFVNMLKAYRLLGITSQNQGQYDQAFNEYIGVNFMTSTTNINLLYTPFIDIISESLTKYQNVKDTDTSAQKLNSMIARVYLAGSGPPQFVTDGIAEQIGARPFTVTQDTQYPKVMRWSRDEAINSIDFQLRDQYGDLIFTSTRNLAQTAQYFFTEFQMTLLCVEGKKNY